MRVGIFDSGIGGLAALKRLSELCPNADAVLYQDRENAPYGTKSESELIKLVSDDIDKLEELGAKTVLMACCTAGTVWDKLTPKRRKISIPIIAPVAKRALGIAIDKPIGVICTQATEKSGAFQRAIQSLSPGTEVITLAAQELVGLAEEGIGDGCMNDCAYRAVEKIKHFFSDKKIGAIILGCTHFSYFEGVISDALSVRAVNSAHVGAELLADRIRADLR